MKLHYFKSVHHLVEWRGIKGFTSDQVEEIMLNRDVEFPDVLKEAFTLFGSRTLGMYGGSILMNFYTGVLDISKYNTQLGYFRDSYAQYARKPLPEDVFLIDSWDLNSRHAFIRLNENSADPVVYYYVPGEDKYFIGAPSFSHYVLNSPFINFLQQRFDRYEEE